MGSMVMKLLASHLGGDCCYTALESSEDHKQEHINSIKGTSKIFSFTACKGLLVCTYKSNHLGERGWEKGFNLLLCCISVLQGQN